MECNSLLLGVSSSRYLTRKNKFRMTLPFKHATHALSTMPSACVVGGCSNEPSSKVSLHRYPANARRCMRWDRFVRQTLRDFRCGNKRTVVCSEHFCKDDFKNAQAHRLGFAKHLRLKSKAVPSIKPDAVRVMARN